jgi:hypothetical protein
MSNGTTNKWLFREAFHLNLIEVAADERRERLVEQQGVALPKPSRRRLTLNSTWTIQQTGEIAPGSSRPCRRYKMPKQKRYG